MHKHLKKPVRLQLAIETLRRLSDTELVQAVGGKQKQTAVSCDTDCLPTTLCP